MGFQVTILGIFLIIIYRVQYIESIKVFLPLLNCLNNFDSQCLRPNLVHFCQKDLQLGLETLFYQNHNKFRTFDTKKD